MENINRPREAEILNKLELADLFPEIEEVSMIQALWRELININQSLSGQPKQMDANHASNWPVPL